MIQDVKVLDKKTNTETLEQQKSNNWTPVGSTKDKASRTNQLKF